MPGGLFFAPTSSAGATERRAGCANVDQLQAADIAALRTCVRRLDRRNAGCGRTGLRLVNGPLHGLRLTLDSATRNHRFVGICHLTDAGLIQVVYKRTSSTELRFHSIEWPRGRLPSMPKNPFEPPSTADQQKVIGQ